MRMVERFRLSPSGLWWDAGKSAGTRLIVLVTSAILGIIITRMIILNYGDAAYAQYGLIVAMGTLLPFADLGIAAAVMNSVGGSERPGTDDAVRRTLLSALRVSCVSGAVVVLLSVVITSLGWWVPILGSALIPGQGVWAAAISLMLIGVAIPFGVGQRVLSALGKNHVAVGLLGLQSPLVLGILAVVVATGLQVGGLLPIIPYFVTLLIVIIATVIALAWLRPAFPHALRQLVEVRRHRGAPVMNQALPLMVQMIALPVAMQTDRIVLSHVSTVADLSEYNLASQIFGPVLSLIGAAGFTLWPVFAKARSRNEHQSPYPVALGFGLLAALICLALALLSPFLADIASDGQVELSTTILVSFGLLMTLQGLKYPLGIYLTDTRGLWFQAYMVIAMVPVNLALSILLAERVGAAGPVIGSVVGVALFQVVANALYIRIMHPAPAADPTGDTTQAGSGDVRS